MRHEHLGHVNPFLIKWLHRPLNFIKTNPLRPNHHVASFLVDFEMSEALDDVGDVVVELSRELDGSHVLTLGVVGVLVHAGTGDVCDKGDVLN
jgi:hypothetical protein